MTRVYVCAVDAPLEASLPQSVTEHISKAKSGTLNRSRLSAYRLLFEALGDFLNETASASLLFAGSLGSFDFSSLELCFEKSGKPYLKKGSHEFPIKISLSHTDELAAVALSDGSRVGVDIEGEIDADRAQRLESRFFREVIKPRQSGELDCIKRLCSGAVTVLEPKIGSTEECRPLTERWVICEAVLKCEGGGFGSFARLEELAKEAEVYSGELDFGEKKHFVALAQAAENE